MQAVSDVYTIPQENLDFCATIGQIAREKIAPRSAEIDERAEYPWDIRRILAEQDILGLPFPSEYGRRLVCTDPDGAGARHAADPDVRLR
jgi:alkylation response protein AidB-like acyl-CoA dehydrogenase